MLVLRSFNNCMIPWGTIITADLCVYLVSFLLDHHHHHTITIILPTYLPSPPVLNYTSSLPILFSFPVVLFLARIIWKWYLERRKKIMMMRNDYVDDNDTLLMIVVMVKKNYTVLYYRLGKLVRWCYIRFGFFWKHDYSFSKLLSLRSK